MRTERDDALDRIRALVIEAGVPGEKAPYSACNSLLIGHASDVNGLCEVLAGFAANKIAHGKDNPLPYLLGALRGEMNRRFGERQGKNGRMASWVEWRAARRACEDCKNFPTFERGGSCLAHYYSMPEGEPPPLPSP